MFASAATALRQIFSRPFRAALFKTVGLTLLILAALVVGLVTLFGLLATTIPGWLETTIQVVGGLGLVVGSIFLVPPVSAIVAGLFMDDIADEVERRYYPGDPPGRPLPLFASIVIAVKFFFLMLGVMALALILLIIPGVNIVAFFLANSYLLGREFFEFAAMRHMKIEEARALRANNALRVFIAGMPIAGIALIPIVNLLTPLFATAYMTHNYKRIAARAGAAIGAGRSRAA
jgi:CysZ protein